MNRPPQGVPWFADHHNIVELATDLVDEHGFDASALLDFIEKPWHYADEWGALQKRKRIAELAKAS